MPDEAYRFKLAAATADGASVNFGRYGGLITLLKQNREWMVGLHCSNHRIELAVKDSILEDEYYASMDEFYITNFYLLKNSGPLKGQVKKATEVIGITSYSLTKLSGTRFVSHHKKALFRLLHMWPAFIMGYENAIPNIKTHSTRAKVQGLLKKFRNPDFLYKCCSYLDIIEHITPASLVFERNDLFVFYNRT